MICERKVPFFACETPTLSLTILFQSGIMVKTQYICHIMLFLFIRLAEMASVYKNSRRVTVRGQLRCGGHPLRNAIASVVAQTPDRGMLDKASARRTF